MGLITTDTKIRHFKKMELLKHYKLLPTYRSLDTESQKTVSDILDVLWDEQNIFNTTHVARIICEVRKSMCSQRRGVHDNRTAKQG